MDCTYVFEQLYMNHPDPKSPVTTIKCGSIEIFEVNANTMLESLMGSLIAMLYCTNYGHNDEQSTSWG